MNIVHTLPGITHDIEQLLDNMSDGYVVYDKQWRLQYINRKGAELIGRPRGELMGKTLFELFPEVETDDGFIHSRKAIQEEHEDTLEYFSTSVSRWLKVKIIPSLTGITCYFSDITEKKKLEENALFLEAVADSLQDALISTNNEYRIIGWNAAAEKMYGWSAQEAVGKTVQELFKTVYKAGDGPETIGKIIMEKGHWEGEVKHHHRSGTLISVRANLSVLKNEKNELIGLVALNRDVTTERKAEAAQMQLSAIVESSHDAIVSKNLDGIIQTWNHAAEKIFGYTSAEIIGRHITTIIPPELIHEEEEIIGKIKKGIPIDHFDTVRLRKDGARVNISLTISPIKNAQGQIIGASKIARDITERIMSEKALRESENRFRILAENIQTMAWMANPDGWIFWCNQHWYEYLGSSFETIKGRGWEQTLHPDHSERVHEFLSTAWTQGEPWELTFPLRSKEGNYNWFLTSAYPVRDSNGELLRWIGTCTNVNAFKN